MMLVFNYYLALISHLKGMQDSSKLSIVFFTIYQLLKKVPFHGFSTKILLLWHGFPLARFFSGQKNRVKRGVPVLHNVWCIKFRSKHSSIKIWFARAYNVRLISFAWNLNFENNKITRKEPFTLNYLLHK